MQSNLHRASHAPPPLAAESVRVPVHTLDKLFDNETLGFVHLDVEGAEASVLRGARAVFARDAPLMTTEVHLASPEAADLFRELEALDYEAYEVRDEVCGIRQDCRNLVNLPRRRQHKMLAFETARAVRAGVLRPVNRKKKPYVGGTGVAN